MSDRAKTFLLAAAAPALFVALLPLAAVQTRGSRPAGTTVAAGPATERASASVMSTIVVSAHRQRCLGFPRVAPPGAFRKGPTLPPGQGGGSPRPSGAGDPHRDFPAPGARGQNSLLGSGRISDLIATVPTTFMGESTFGGQPVSTNSNINRARIQGVEASFRLNWSGWGWWSLRAEPSWQRGVDLPTGDPLPLIAPFTVLSGLEWSPRAGRVSLRVEMRSALGGDRVPPGAEPLSGFTVIALGGELKLFDDAGFFRPTAGLPNRLNWRIENLTDKRYRELFNSVSAPELDLRLVLGWKLGRRQGETTSESHHLFRTSVSAGSPGRRGIGSVAAARGAETGDFALVVEDFDRPRPTKRASSPSMRLWSPKTAASKAI